MIFAIGFAKKRNLRSTCWKRKIIGDDSELEEPLVRCFAYLLVVLAYLLGIGDGRRLVYIGMEMCIANASNIWRDRFCSDRS